MTNQDGYDPPSDTDEMSESAEHTPSGLNAVAEGPEHGSLEDVSVDATKEDPPKPVLQLDTTLSGSASAPGSDATSAVSAPSIEVSEPQTPRAAEAPAASPLASMPPPSPTRSQRSSADATASPREPRTPQRRSTIDGRPPSNRLSGFFTHLVGRRSHLPSPSTPSGTQAIQEESEQQASLNHPKPARVSSSSSQLPTRPSTPPPLLPPPSLMELGLTLSTITSSLSPSHFSTPPTSGAFLAPHYLLLCHAQGLDVLPLVYPPVPQPYALVRRVSFKCVVVMEHRGVLVAIAGRRDGVRVYALEEVKKAVEWRIEVEVRRERERAKREESRKPSIQAEPHRLSEKSSKQRLRGIDPPKAASGRKASATPTVEALADSRKTPSVTKLIPTRQPSSASLQADSRGPPPAYGSLTPPSSRPRLESHTSTVTLQPRRARGQSVSDALAALPSDTPNPTINRSDSADAKGDWVELNAGSDEEAIDLVAAGASGGQALDERTSSMSPHPPSGLPRPDITPIIPLARVSTSQTVRRQRPADLDLTDALPDPTVTLATPQPSPIPTLMTIRHTLSQSPHSTRGNLPTMRSVSQDLDAQRTGLPNSPDPDDEDDDETETPAREQISFAQALSESRLPDLPPPGTRRPQHPILITSQHAIVTGDEEPMSPRSSEAHSTRSARSMGASTIRRRRRWSVLEGIFTGPPAPDASQPPPPPPPPTHLSRTATRPATSPVPPTSAPVEPAESRRTTLSRSSTARGSTSPSSVVRARASASTEALATTNMGPRSLHSPSGLITRLLNSAFHPRRSEDRSQTITQRHSDSMPSVPGHPAPAPKLEYVKLPGTKGAILIKSVETAKKSFLAILCGESGEKVELFAGTYRTALGLSRTFILPDSPRSLELQLQGDDLVEVFLVFSQNVFGLEPATVRVREVRIGRAERRAARRRARNGRPEESTSGSAAPGEDETNVNVSIGVAVSSQAAAPANEDGESAPLEPGTNASAHAITAVPDGPGTPQESSSAVASAPTAEELIALATAQMGPFTTFQQLSFSPNFPLASIADEYIIPPTYASFLKYRREHEPEEEGNGDTDLAQVQFSPPGLPVPTPAPPSKWCYRDPKGAVHGPWKASLMHSWYKDGLLPPDLPVRREEDMEYILLKDLRAQSVDPTHPFRPAPPPLDTPPLLLAPDQAKPLLRPISLLSQPRHFGPPALFFSSRGGHSTTIVDARGRSVIKGRFVWTADDGEDDSFGKLGDVKRLEAFDVKKRSVLVALRQGGLEAVDLGDALLKPGDDSRPVLPHFHPPDVNVNRRSPFIWKIGSPTAFPHGTSAAAATLPLPKARTPRTPAKKQGLAPAKSPGRPDFSLGSDGDAERFGLQDEVFFIGRKDDEVYFCERNAGTFRILRLCPSQL